MHVSFGYAPYNPAMLTKYLTIFRAVHNFVFVGSGKRHIRCLDGPIRA